jgi:hypothetical protein
MTRTASPFPDHHPRPVSVTVIEGIERTARAVWQLHEAMRATPAEHRWLAMSMTSPEVAEILTMLHADDREFAAHGIRDLGPLMATREAQRGSPRSA